MAENIITPEIIDFLSSKDVNDKLITVSTSTNRTNSVISGFVDSIKVIDGKEIAIQIGDKNENLMGEPLIFKDFDKIFIGTDSICTKLRLQHLNGDYSFIQIYGV